MNPETSNHDNSQSEQKKPHTPDKIRNEHARWKDHDQPDVPRDKGLPDPERDYPNPSGQPESGNRG